MVEAMRFANNLWSFNDSITRSIDGHAYSVDVPFCYVDRLRYFYNTYSIFNFLFIVLYNYDYPLCLFGFFIVVVLYYLIYLECVIQEMKVLN